MFNYSSSTTTLSLKTAVLIVKNYGNVKENYYWYSYRCSRFDHGEFICLYSNLLAFSTIFVVS
jgi:hypothetical protein